MSLLNNAIAKTDPADLVILSIIETIRDQEQPATSSAVASLIGGARVVEIASRLSTMRQLGLLEIYSVSNANMGYQLTEMGAELMRSEMEGWSPSVREERRREIELVEARKGIWRSRMR